MNQLRRQEGPDSFGDESGLIRQKGRLDSLKGYEMRSGIKMEIVSPVFGPYWGGLVLVLSPRASK